MSDRWVFGEESRERVAKKGQRITRTPCRRRKLRDLDQRTRVCRAERRPGVLPEGVDRNNAGVL